MNVVGEFVICIQHICMNFSSLNLCFFPQSSIIRTLKHILFFLCFDISCIYGSKNCYRELKTVIEKENKIFLEIIGQSCGFVLLITK